MLVPVDLKQMTCFLLVTTSRVPAWFTLNSLLPVFLDVRHAGNLLATYIWRDQGIKFSDFGIKCNRFCLDIGFEPRLLILFKASWILHHQSADVHLR